MSEAIKWKTQKFSGATFSSTRRKLACSERERERECWGTECSRKDRWKVLTVLGWLIPVPRFGCSPELPEVWLF